MYIIYKDAEDGDLVAVREPHTTKVAGVSLPNYKGEEGTEIYYDDLAVNYISMTSYVNYIPTKVGSLYIVSKTIQCPQKRFSVSFRDVYMNMVL